MNARAFTTLAMECDTMNNVKEKQTNIEIQFDYSNLRSIWFGRMKRIDKTWTQICNV